MSEYVAVDRETLHEQLDELSDVLENVELTDEQAEKAEEAFSELNGIINGFDQPIHITDRSDGFEIIVHSDE
jgi:hypothetical protein